MTQSRTKYEFFKEASLSQQLAHKIEYNGEKIYPFLAGADPKTSETIGNLKVLRKHGLLKISEKTFSLVMDLLNMKRMALFATSEKVNEISKMGMQDPKEEDIFGASDDENP